MNYKPIVIVAGEPNSIFSEIFFKVLENKKFKSPIILICSKKLFIKQAKLFNKKFNFNILELKKIRKNEKNLKKINIIDIEYSQTKAFDKISPKSNRYLEKCFNAGIHLMNLGISNKFINGPISKKNFLKNKFNGITEYLAYKTNTKKFCMIIYNSKLSVSPITTHIPIKYISKTLTISLICERIKLINNFWLKCFRKKPKIALTGLNPHCESIDKINEDEKIIIPSVKLLKKDKININGPFPADTIFLKYNRNKHDVIVGMYHDQVLTPIKTLFEYNAINITIGLPFIRISPDHGPNEKMAGKNLSNPESLFRSIKFLDFK